MKTKNPTQARKPQYHSLVRHYRQFVDRVIEVSFRKKVNSYGDMDNGYITGELLEVKDQGLCIAQDNNDGESFVPFSTIRAYEKYADKCDREDFEYLTGPDYTDDLKFNATFRGEM